MLMMTTNVIFLVCLLTIYLSMLFLLFAYSRLTYQCHFCPRRAPFPLQLEQLPQEVRAK